jgi:two-component system response regulator TtrR
MPDIVKYEATSTKAFRAALPEILLVEDEAHSRRELKRVLTRNGFRVRAASSGTEALQEAEAGEVGILLMDVRLGDGPDGIQTAQEIQQGAPGASVLFVTAYANSPELRRRAESEVLYIAGWVEKPIQVPEIPSLLEKITSELIKVRVRGLLQQGPQGDKEQQLHRIAERDSSVSPQIVEEMLDELHRSATRESAMNSLSAKIDGVYDEIHALIERNAGKPGLRENLLPLRGRLRALQAQEAKIIADHYDAHFRPLYDEAQEEIRRAQQLVRKK